MVAAIDSQYETAPRELSCPPATDPAVLQGLGRYWATFTVTAGPLADEIATHDVCYYNVTVYVPMSCSPASPII